MISRRPLQSSTSLRGEDLGEEDNQQSTLTPALSRRRERVVLILRVVGVPQAMAINGST
jgi:hypothetical protein